MPTRIAHATTLLDFDGHVVLTDPWFSDKPGYHPGEPRPLSVVALPPLAGVVISHAHYDHCDLASFAAYRDKAVPMVVKRGLGKAVRAAGFREVTEVDAGEVAKLGPVQVTATAAKHLVPEVTFILEGSGSRVFFGADTLHVPELDDLAHRFGPIDLALMPINGLTIRPLLNRQVVMNAEQAAQLTAALHPRVAVPIHYAFTGGPIQDRLILKKNPDPGVYVDAAAEHAPDTTVTVLPPGVPLTL